ncbi:hypothetical protein [Dongia sedimenti]|uniref:Uncharacterized protein n=1 Tax=Dongia sedimenti TaxID=3064282 RepID=A0ABU0YNP3_9PROT|nr:hypothetical protein [Rhodospirillaceae bacterium R-7]
MLSVVQWSLVPSEPGKTIVQIWNTGSEARGHPQAPASQSVSATPIRLSSE